MRKLHQAIIAVFIVTLSGASSYVAADEATFGSTGDYTSGYFTPIWFGKRLDEKPEWTRRGDEWFHSHKDGTRPYQHTFDWVGPFSEGLAPVRKDGREFHIRIDGSHAYKATYDAVGPFNMGYAVAVQDNNWFHIKTDGIRAYEKNFRWADGVSDKGSAHVKDELGVSIVINMKGERMH